MNKQRFRFYAINMALGTEDKGEVVLDMDGDAISNNVGASMMQAARWAIADKTSTYGKEHADGTVEGVKWVSPATEEAGTIIR